MRQSPHCAAKCLQHARSSGQRAITCNIGHSSRATLGAHHVQHWALITCNSGRSSRATLGAHHVQHWALITCNMWCTTWYNGTAQPLRLTVFKSHSFQFYFIGDAQTLKRRTDIEATHRRQTTFFYILRSTSLKTIVQRLSSSHASGFYYV